MVEPSSSTRPFEGMYWNTRCYSSDPTEKPEITVYIVNSYVENQEHKIV